MKKLIAFAAVAALTFTATASFAQSTSTSNSGAASNTNVVVQSNSAGRVKTTGNAIAPGLISGGIETCQGSTSASAAGMGWGVAFGSTRMDIDCNRRLNAKMVGLLGDGLAAKEVMCGTPEVRAAFARVGRPCIADRVAARQAVTARANNARPAARPKVQTVSASQAPCSLFGSNRCR